MRLSPAEEERLQIFTLAELARRRRSRRRLLSAPEVIAIITDEVMEAAWDGLTYAEVLGLGMSAVRACEALPGAAGLVRRIEIDALFPTGTALVALTDPLGPPGLDAPGAVLVATARRELNVGRKTLALVVENASRVSIRVTSHYPFWQTNLALRFDRDAAVGFRLDIPSGSNISFPPATPTPVTLVALAGLGTAPSLYIQER